MSRLAPGAGPNGFTRAGGGGQDVIRAFSGFVTNADPHDVPPGTAVKQVNARSVRPGELRARPGCKVVQFD